MSFHFEKLQECEQLICVCLQIFSEFFIMFYYFFILSKKQEHVSSGAIVNFRKIMFHSIFGAKVKPLLRQQVIPFHVSSFRRLVS